jgi:hypothetical protein
MGLPASIYLSETAYSVLSAYEHVGQRITLSRWSPLRVTLNLVHSFDTII